MSEPPRADTRGRTACDAYYSQPRRDLLPLVPASARTVLDCGCGSGRFGEALKANGCRVTGIEVCHEAAIAARTRLDCVLEGTIEATLPGIAPESFDCIVCADILEHLVDPWSIVRELTRRLRPEGVLLCSVPNVRHLSVLVDLVFRGSWTYQDSGILDRAHVRFFTRKTAIEMLHGAGLELEFVTGNPESFSGLLALASACLRPLNSELRVAQWLIRARKRP